MPVEDTDTRPMFVEGSDTLLAPVRLHNQILSLTSAFLQTYYCENARYAREVFGFDTDLHRFVILDPRTLLTDKPVSESALYQHASVLSNHAILYGQSEFKVVSVTCS